MFLFRVYSSSFLFSAVPLVLDFFFWFVGCLVGQSVGWLQFATTMVLVRFMGISKFSNLISNSSPQCLKINFKIKKKECRLLVRPLSEVVHFTRQVTDL